MRWQLLGDFSEYEKECAAEREQQRLTEGQEQLRQLLRGGSFTIEEAAEQLGVDSRTIRRQADALEKKGFLQRQRSGKTYRLSLPNASQPDVADDPDACSQLVNAETDADRIQLELCS